MANIALQPVTVNGHTITVAGQYSGLQAGDTVFGVTLRYRVATPLTGPVTGTAAGLNGQIVITSANHGLFTNNQVNVQGVMGTSEANGIWRISVLTPDQFLLLDSQYSHLFNPPVQTSAVWQLVVASTETALPLPANPPPPNFSKTFRIDQAASYVIWAELSWSGSPPPLKSAEVPFSII
jgi:hypothetical protein